MSQAQPSSVLEKKRLSFTITLPRASRDCNTSLMQSSTIATRLLQEASTQSRLFASDAFRDGCVNHFYLLLFVDTRGEILALFSFHKVIQNEYLF